VGLYFWSALGVDDMASLFAERCLRQPPRRIGAEISGHVGGGVLLPAYAAPSWFLNRLQEPVSDKLVHERVIVNDGGRYGRQEHDPTHIEITEDTIDIVFDTVEQYKHYASLLSATEEELEQVGIPRHLVPIDAINNTSFGGGATIKLSRRAFLDHLHSLRQPASKKPTPVLQ